MSELLLETLCNSLEKGEFSWTKDRMEPSKGYVMEHGSNTIYIVTVEVGKVEVVE